MASRGGFYKIFPEDLYQRFKENFSKRFESLLNVFNQKAPTATEKGKERSTSPSSKPESNDRDISQQENLSATSVAAHNVSSAHIAPQNNTGQSQSKASVESSNHPLNRPLREFTEGNRRSLSLIRQAEFLYESWGPRPPDWFDKKSERDNKLHKGLGEFFQDAQYQLFLSNEKTFFVILEELQKKHEKELTSKSDVSINPKNELGELKDKIACAEDLLEKLWELSNGFAENIGEKFEELEELEKSRDPLTKDKKFRELRELKTFFKGLKVSLSNSIEGLIEVKKWSGMDQSSKINQAPQNEALVPRAMNQASASSPSAELAAGSSATLASPRQVTFRESRNLIHPISAIHTEDEQSESGSIRQSSDAKHASQAAQAEGIATDSQGRQPVKTTNETLITRRAHKPIPEIKTGGDPNAGPASAAMSQASASQLSAECSSVGSPFPSPYLKGSEGQNSIHTILAADAKGKHEQSGSSSIRQSNEVNLASPTEQVGANINAPVSGAVGYPPIANADRGPAANSPPAGEAKVSFANMNAVLEKLPTKADLGESGWYVDEEKIFAALDKRARLDEQACFPADLSGAMAMKKMQSPSATNASPSLVLKILTAMSGLKKQISLSTDRTSSMLTANSGALEASGRKRGQRH